MVNILTNLKDHGVLYPHTSESQDYNNWTFPFRDSDLSTLSADLTTLIIRVALWILSTALYELTAQPRNVYILGFMMNFDQFIEIKQVLFISFLYFHKTYSIYIIFPLSSLQYTNAIVNGELSCIQHSNVISDTLLY